MFNIAGLSCVTTDSDYRGQGIGLQTVAAATQWIREQSDIDFGIFTCEPSLADFYKRAVAWSVVPDITLICSKDEETLSSKKLGVVVLMRFFQKNPRIMNQCYVILLSILIFQLVNFCKNIITIRIESLFKKKSLSLKSDFSPITQTACIY